MATRTKNKLYTGMGEKVRRNIKKYWLSVLVLSLIILFLRYKYYYGLVFYFGFMLLIAAIVIIKRWKTFKMVVNYGADIVEYEVRRYKDVKRKRQGKGKGGNK